MNSRKWYSTLMVVAIAVSFASVTACGKRLSIVKKESAPSVQEPSVPSEEGAFPEMEPPKGEPVVVEDLPVAAETDIQEEQPEPSPALSAGLQDVFFDFDRALITEGGAALLKQNATWLLDNRNVKIRIEGTTDERGTNVYNLALGERRAAAVKNYLISLGVEGRRIETISYGEEKQFCNESNEACWAQNRRGHFVTPSSARL